MSKIEKLKAKRNALFLQIGEAEADFAIFSCHAGAAIEATGMARRESINIMEKALERSERLEAQFNDLNEQIARATELDRQIKAFQAKALSEMVRRGNIANERIRKALGR